MKRNISISIIIALIAVFVVSCTNENKGYQEYYHPMGNNPVQVVPWLKKLRKSFSGKEARISHYELNKKEYFVAQVFEATSTLPISPFTIYETDDEVEIVYFHTDDALVSEQDSVYIDFIENATLLKLLWSNEPSYSLVEEVY